MQITIKIEPGTEAHWGVEYARQEANKNTAQRMANVVMQNEQIEKANSEKLPEFQQPLLELPIVHTDESMLQSKIDECISQMTRTMKDAARNNLIAFAEKLPPDVLAQMIAAAGAPPLIQE